MNLCGGIFDYDVKRERLEEVERELESPEVWSEPERAQSLGRERASLETTVNSIAHTETALRDTAELLELAKSENDESMIADIANELDEIETMVAGLEFQRMFAGEMDAHNAFVDIQAGSGGTEAQDWADIDGRVFCALLLHGESRSAHHSSHARHR